MDHINKLIQLLRRFDHTNSHHIDMVQKIETVVGPLNSWVYLYTLLKNVSSISLVIVVGLNDRQTDTTDTI